jgi:hypothetical protein
MNERQVDRLAAHFDKYFEQSRAGVMRSNAIEDLQVFLYAPTQKYPFWKMVTAGASDVICEGERTEVMIFIDGRTPLMQDARTVNPGEIAWYFNVLVNSALYPKNTGHAIRYRKVIEFDCGSGMRGVTALLPKVIDDVGIFTCQINENKVVHCYLMITVTEQEINDFKKNGVDYLDSYFYPAEGKIKFFCEPYRTEF